MKDWLRMLLCLAALVFGWAISAWFSYANAAEASVLYFAQSKHFKDKDDPEKYNERNHALGLEVTGKRHGFTVGRYHDSFGTTARYIGGLYLTAPATWRAGIMYGVIRSPSYDDGQHLPFVIPYITTHYKMIGFNLLVMPKFTSQGAYVLGLQYKVRFEL